MAENRIIAFSGRKESGKTEIARVCRNHGYQIISFAAPLKTLVSHILGITIDEINSLKNVKTNYEMTLDKIEIISSETDIPLPLLKEVLLDKIFSTTREVLQYIGTDVIRKYNPLWHINKTRESLNNDDKYIIDDLRFPNEKAMVEELGGDCWFFIRPKVTNISNHESEIALKWQDFEKVCVNDMTLSYLKFNWNMIFEIGYDECMKLRHKLIGKIKNNNTFDVNLLEFSKKDEHFNTLDVLFISKYIFSYKNEFESIENVKEIEIIDEKTLQITFNSSELEEIVNPLLIENLKFYIN